MTNSLWLAPDGSLVTFDEAVAGTYQNRGLANSPSYRPWGSVAPNPPATARTGIPSATPVTGTNSGVNAWNASASIGGTGGQAAAAGRVATAPAVKAAVAQALSRPAIQTGVAAARALPVSGAAMAGGLGAVSAYAGGAGWFESVGAGVGAAGGAVVGSGIGAAGGALATANPAGVAAGSVAGQVAGGYIGQSIGQGLASTTASIAGRIPGVGGAIAAAANTFIPGAGFIPLAGGALGGWLQPDDVAGTPVPATSENTDGPLPFTGGQMPGVRYGLITRRADGDQVGNTLFVWGPVTGLSVVKTSGINERTTFSGFNGQGQPLTVTSDRGTTGNEPAGSATIYRADAQPDTGGNPAPTQIPIPAIRPRNSYPPELPRTPPDAAPDVVPAPYAPTPSQEPSPTPPLRPNGPPETAPDAPPPAPETLPPGDPLMPPAPAPDGSPSGAPLANPSNVPSPLSTPAPAPDNNSWPDWLIPALAGAGVGAGAALTSQRISNPTQPGDFVQIPPATPAPPIPSPPDTGCRCNGPILAGQAGQTADINDLRARLIRIEGTQNGPTGFAGTYAFLTEMRIKLGAIGDFAETAWRATKMQKVLDVLTFIGVMHNVSMLSREVGETLFTLVGQGLDVVGIDDEEGNALNVGSIVGGSVNNFLRGVFGEVFIDGAIDSYRKANRIVQSASMVIWTVRSIQDSSLDLMEWVGENTGKIGNALKRFGVVGDRSYPWMAESAQARARGRARFDKITGALENAEDRLSSYTVATSNILEVQQETQELGENWQSFKTSLNDIPDPWGDNTPVQSQVAAEVAASPSPEIAAADTQRTN